MTAADPIILVTLVISGVLATVRGFTLELLGLIALVLAALIALLLFPVAHGWIGDSLPDGMIGNAILVGVLFFGTLVPLWIAGHRLGDGVRGSRVGVLDRSAGFVFGLLRGLFLLAIAYLVFTGFAGGDIQEPDWLADAKLMPLVRASADLLVALKPDEATVGASFGSAFTGLPD